MEAREFGEKLCEKTATHWAAAQLNDETSKIAVKYIGCLLYTSPSPRDLSTSRMPSSA